jgi:hypothetical protein
MIRRLLLVSFVPLGLLLVAPSVFAVMGHSESANQFVKAAAKALASAKSVRISGTISVSGESESMDFVLFANKDLEGTLTLAGYPVHVIVVNGTDYYRGSAAWWHEVGGLPSADAKKIAGVWIKTPKSSSANIGNSFQIAPLASSLKATSGLAIVGHKKLDGRAAVGVKLSNGGVLWIASSGTQYPISEVKQGKSAASLSFSGWNSFALPKAPKGAIALS